MVSMCSSLIKYGIHSPTCKGCISPFKIAWLIYQNWGEGKSCYDLERTLYFYDYNFYLLLPWLWSLHRLCNLANKTASYGAKLKTQTADKQIQYVFTLPSEVQSYIRQSILLPRVLLEISNNFTKQSMVI